MKKLLILLSFFVLTLSVNAQKKISQLPVATSVTGTDLFVIVNSGATKQLAGSILLGAVSDTANVLRTYIGDLIYNIEITSPQVIDESLGTIDLNENASSFIVTAGGPKIKTTTSAGDSIVKRVAWYPSSVGDVLVAKACFYGVGVGKMMVYNSSGGLAVSGSTSTGTAYTLNYIETEVVVLTSSTFGVSQKIYGWDGYTDTFTHTDYAFTEFSYTGYPSVTLSIKYNSTTIGFKCSYYTVEHKPMHPGFSNNVFNN